MNYRDELREEAQVALLGAADKIDALEKKLARLEDLRRWRPMSEMPVDARNVLSRDDEDHFFRGLAYCLNGSWHQLKGRPVRPDLEWTYIPGQEPVEALAEMRKP